VLDLQLAPGARELVLDAAPLGMDALAAPGDARYRHLVVRDGQLAWLAMPAANRAPGPAPGSARIRLLDRNGAALWHDGTPTDAARTAGLAPLLGVRAEQASGVAGMLARLPGAGPHAARLTLDLGLQQAAQAALDCIGLRQGHWDGRACSGAATVPEGRQAGLVVLDTETGDILAAAGSGGGNIEDADWRELRDFDRVDPAASPLRLPAWQHDGGAERSPGSTFKIVSALGLELAARSDPRLDALLDGLPLAGINRLAQERGFDFRTDAPSFPVGARARITNFRDQGLDRRAQDGRLGLAQALTYSLNTWFAWLGELSDRSLAGSPTGGVPDLQPLQPGALDSIRPIVAMARRLGFGEPLRLDGGLLPPDYPWSAWDALQATPAGIDPVHTRHELRQMAIGLRMQATPLQMALVAGAVGQGRTIRPRLLAELDGKPGESMGGTPLGVRLDRVRAGMKGVVNAGTAAGAFRGAGLEGVRRGLSGKTGTAPVGDGSLATVWFTGWLEPGSVPGQAHRLALAVFVSQSEGTGGGHAAPVAAAVLRHLAAQNAKP
jgi:cell division protein FtsI/penicillin-binding protein 2